MIEMEKKGGECCDIPNMKERESADDSHILVCTALAYYAYIQIYETTSQQKDTVLLHIKHCDSVTQT